MRCIASHFRRASFTAGTRCPDISFASPKLRFYSVGAKDRCKTIGVLGGMSCESTAVYYNRLNAQARRRLGGLNSADCLIRSVNFSVIEAMQRRGDWDEAGQYLAEEALKLQRAGAELIILATNTMHKVAPAIEAALSIPFLHIADATAEQISVGGFRKPGLLGTAYTMRQDFYVGRLVGAGLEVVLPSEADMDTVHRIIFEELCLGKVEAASRKTYEDIAAELKTRGADCVILGCTEVGMLLSGENSPLPVFDTTMIHCDAALDRMLGIEL